MLTTTARYGRPKGTGVDDRRQLESLAALLAANPALKPTTAIRALGVEDPSVIRRLRDKFRMDQARLMADAHRSCRSNGRALACPGPLQPTSRRPLASVRPISRHRRKQRRRNRLSPPPLPPCLSRCCWQSAMTLGSGRSARRWSSKSCSPSTGCDYLRSRSPCGVNSPSALWSSRLQRRENQ